MGVYLVSVDEADWAEDELLVDAAPLLSRALKDRGLPDYTGPPRCGPIAPGEGTHFEEKLYRPMESYAALIERHLGDTVTVSWDMLMPVEFDGLIRLDTVSAYFDITAVASSAHVLAAMKILATAIELPVEQLPPRSDNLDIGDWFDEVEAASGRWSDDLDAAYYVAINLRGAQFSLRRHCPMRFV